MPQGGTTSPCPQHGAPPPCITQPCLPVPEITPLRSDLCAREGRGPKNVWVVPHSTSLLPVPIAPIVRATPHYTLALPLQTGLPGSRFQKTKMEQKAVLGRTQDEGGFLSGSVTVIMIVCRCLLHASLRTHFRHSDVAKAPWGTIFFKSHMHHCIPAGSQKTSWRPLKGT